MKKIIILLFLLIGFPVLGQQLVNVGSVPNDHTGDPLRTAFQKHNTNITAIYDSLGNIYTESQTREILHDTIQDRIDNGLDIMNILEDYGGGGGGVLRKEIKFRTDITAGAPETGDSIFTQTSFVGKHLEVWREGNKQYQNATGISNITDGFRFNNTTGEIIFRPVFGTNEQVQITVDDQIY